MTQRASPLTDADAHDDAAILAALQASEWPAMGLSEPQLIRAMEPMPVARVIERITSLWKYGRIDHRCFLGLIFYRVVAASAERARCA